MRKTTEQLSKLSTKRLLEYYRAERLRYDVSVSSYFYGIDKVDYMWEHSDKYEKEKLKYIDWNMYLKSIKSELDSRENVN